jgi:hypothetical protein
MHSMSPLRILRGGIWTMVGNIRTMTTGRSADDFTEAELKHLEFIQGVIARLANNSFLLKGWSVTLVAAILALTVRDPGIYTIFLALFPALVFWGLDAFYLAQERHFREMHKDARTGKIEVLSMDPYSYESGFKGWFGSVKSRSVFPFHVVIVGVVILAAVVQALAGSGIGK